jgi:hypothetical protein
MIRKQISLSPEGKRRSEESGIRSTATNPPHKNKNEKEKEKRK